MHHKHTVAVQPKPVACNRQYLKQPPSLSFSGKLYRLICFEAQSIAYNTKGDQSVTGVSGAPDPFCLCVYEIDLSIFFC